MKLEIWLFCIWFILVCIGIELFIIMIKVIDIHDLLRSASL